MQTALLRLFNAIKVENKQDEYDLPFERTIKNGYVLHPSIKPDSDLLDTIENVIGISGNKANSSFHKSWKIVQDASIELLVIQQAVHYFTTYGYEQLRIYREDTIYIPCEILELPEMYIPLVVIKGMDNQDILESIVNLGLGVALAQETLDDIMIVVHGSQFDNSFVEKIKNRELKALLNDYYGLVPSEPVEFLRHLISKLTNESLLIKNKYLIEKIKQSNGKFLDELIKQAPDNLASIFLRYKPLFLAMKSISRNKTFFNRLRKQAIKLHEPLPNDYLNSVTSQIKHRNLEFETLIQRLEKATIFRKIRLAYALNFRLNCSDSIVYHVRNGRGWATEFEWEGNNEDTQLALDIVLASIAKNMNVGGKLIYIPSNVHYALPATEKQFTGHFPTGSYISVPQDLIVGIYWENTDKRVDLDLSVISETGKVGWDAAYRSEDVLFSGDMTNASNGASELFYIRQSNSEPRILMANYYNFSNGDKVNSKILVGQENPENFGKNYMVKNILASANITISKKQNILGLVVNVEGENRVYFSNVSIGNSITAGNNEQSIQARKYLLASLINSLSLKNILELASAKVIDYKPKLEFIDLSPEALNKMSIIDLIR